MLFIGNWKMYLNEKQSVALARAYARAVARLYKKYGRGAPRAVVCPSLPAVAPVRGVVRGSRVALGAQDGYWVEQGAYTGAVSMRMLRESGARFVLVGHSERRYQFGETDEMITKKLQAAWEFGLMPVLCFGETKAMRDSGKRNSVLKNQLAVLQRARGPYILAYEPVWSIGTGDACEPPHVADVVESVGVWLRQMGVAVPEALLYGGSVHAKNIAAYVALPGIAGVLVGGASIKPREVMAMLAALVVHP